MEKRSCVNWNSKEERQRFYQAVIMDLVELNGPTKVVHAINATREALVGLHPYQPPDLHRLKKNLELLEIETGHPRGITGDELAVFTGAYLSDRKKWDLALSEWEL